MTTFKELIEKRNELVEEINAKFETAETEKRAFNEEEQAEFESKTQEIKNIDTTIKMMEESRKLEIMDVAEDAPQAVEDTFAVESRSFEKYVRENRAEQNWTFGDNGAVIPTTIANKIIERVRQLCPIYAQATKYHVKGKLQFPVYDETGDNGHKVTYAEEFSKLTSSGGKFTQVELNGHLVGTLTKISKSLLNNAQFDLTGYIVNKMAEAIARFLERELLRGEDKIQGVKQYCQDHTIDAPVVTTDVLIELQDKIPQVNQGGCAWYMHPTTLTKLRNLKYTDGTYVLNQNLANGFGYTLLGKPVYTSDTMDEMGLAESHYLFYGDMSCVYVNIRENIEMQMLTEKFADEHALGVVAWLEMDAKVIEPQKVWSLNS